MVRVLDRMILVTKSVRRVSTSKIFPWETRIGLQTKIPKVLSILFRGLGALLLGSNIWEGVLLERMVVLHVVITVKR